MAGLPDRMKAYEQAARTVLLRRCPVIIRVDGRCFHTWTRNLEAPFSETLAESLLHTAKRAGADMQGFRAAYQQSDEVSFLLTDFRRHESEPWLAYNVQKLASVTASFFTAGFNSFWTMGARVQPPATFDARAFNVPREDVANYFLWRMKDWERNSVMMFARAHFSHKQLHGKGRADMHEMLHGVGKNWTTDVPAMFRNGSWIIIDQNTSAARLRTDVLPNYEAVAAIINPLLLEAEEN